MPSTFETDFADAAVADLLAFFGQQITYTPGGGDAVTPWAILSSEQTEEEETPQGRRLRIVRTATLSTDPTLATYGGVAAPGLDDTVTADGKTYAVEADEALGGGMARLRLVRKPGLEKSRPNYRQPGP